MDTLSARLREKLKELDEAHREKCNSVAKVDGIIRQLTTSITALPMQQSRLKKHLTDLGNTQQKITQEIAQLIEAEQALSAREVEATPRLEMRKELLRELGNENVDDTFDISTAEIRRQQVALAERRIELEQKHATIETEKGEVTVLLTDETMTKTREALQTELNAKIEEQKVLNTLRKQALETLTECQRLVEDLEERVTLQKYAENNGLALETDTTDELIRVCRTHQEKIAKKNAAVDGPSLVKSAKSLAKSTGKTTRRRRRYSYSSSSDDEDTSSSTEPYSETCDCSACHPMDNSMYRDQVLEYHRRQDGLTIAGARNSRAPITLRREHGENGWCGHW